MGAAIIVPESDARMTRLIDLFRLTDYDIGMFYKIFNRLDLDQSGLLPISSLFESIEFMRNMYTDCFLDLLDIDYTDGEINFSEFLDIVVTYCMFERNEIFKFCLHIFDEDKTEAISEIDLKQLMDVVHNIEDPSDHVRGNVRLSWNMLTFAENGVINFDDLVDINNKFPTLLAPVFMMQAQMIIQFMGELWWSNKKNVLLMKKEHITLLKVKKEKKEEKKSQENVSLQRKIKYNMGALFYWICPLGRFLYEPSEQEKSIKKVEEKIEKKVKKKKRMRGGLTILSEKNENVENLDHKMIFKTNSWSKYEKKSKDDYFINKNYSKIEKCRKKRTEIRANRKSKRNKDTDLNYQYN